MDFVNCEGWLTELDDMWPGKALSIQVEKEICHLRSPFQDIRLFETTDCGKMLVLDGMIQFTEYDEFAYQEMMTHVPMFSHPAPEKVLVIGGGDGGILRELAKHDTVKEIDICEIDEEVINVCREHVPSLACGFDDPRVNIHIADGSEFIKSHNSYYDVIIVDSSDPIGPGEALFHKAFYAGMKQALNDGGIIASQGESFFLHPEVFCNLLGVVRSLFPICGYSFMLVPTYPGGNIGVCLGSLKHKVNSPARRPSAEQQSKFNYYTPELHQASAVLPAFGQRLIDKVMAADPNSFN
ncbi:MAG: spermidine synthase [Victivallales bacterium]|nr:spermidine synthase [Victivallales bacterium]